MRDVCLKEIMVTQVITAYEKDSLSSVEAKMRQHKIRHIPIVDGHQKLLGIITYQDILGCAPLHRTEEGAYLDREQMDQFILKRVMTADPQTLTPADTVAHVVTMMARDKYGCIPIVTEDKTLVGIVTQIDVLKWLGKKLQDDSY